MDCVFFMKVASPPSAPDIVNVKGGLMDLSTKDGIFVFGAVTAVILVVVVWAVLYYRSRHSGKDRHRHHHRHHRHHRRHEQQSSSNGSDETDLPEEMEEREEGKTSTRERRRRRRRKREHRPRNPTLAETGGLPPIRTEAPPGP